VDVKSILHNYDLHNLTIATLGSHSALDICFGSKKCGFRTLVVAQKGRDKVYSDYYKSDGSRGCVDEVLVLEEFKDILKKEVQQKLLERNAVFIPHRSFQVYLDFNYDAIENAFSVPILGNRSLLRIEERDSHPNQYDLLTVAGIRIPQLYPRPEDIDRAVLVKVLEKERGFERAFFLASSPQAYIEKSQELLKKGIISEDAIQRSTIEEFIVGVQVNLNYFYSPLSGCVEFMGADTRRQTNLEGFIRLPAEFQHEASKYMQLKYEEAGHIAVTILESMLEDVFEMGERFVAATQKLYPPGIIGPFALQAFIVPGPPKKEFVVFDVSPRMPGSPGISATPYSDYFWGRKMSMGDRIAVEIIDAKKSDDLPSLLT
jgi:5-formaminoimidazole-4-carboxamide-1-(beta)-D-ribofuranosyl 5'-monophosphate synthetase